MRRRPKGLWPGTSGVNRTKNSPAANKIPIWDPDRFRLGIEEGLGSLMIKEPWLWVQYSWSSGHLLTLSTDLCQTLLQTETRKVKPDNQQGLCWLALLVSLGEGGV